jgi:RNA polymerase sigma-70 factor (ECF subfamily)
VTEIFRRYYSYMELERTIEVLAPRLLRFCTGLTRDPAEGEELAQEALVSLVRYWRTHGTPQSPEAFAYTVARRQAHRWRRRLRRLLSLDALQSWPHEGPGAEVETMHRERLREAVLALGRLRERDREALLLAADPEMAVEDAAGVLGIKPSAYKMRVHRARMRLSSLMEKSHDVREAETEKIQAGS